MAFTGCEPLFAYESTLSMDSETTDLTHHVFQTCGLRMQRTSGHASAGVLRYGEAMSSFPVPQKASERYFWILLQLSCFLDGLLEAFAKHY